MFIRDETSQAASPALPFRGGISYVTTRASSSKPSPATGEAVVHVAERLGCRESEQPPRNGEEISCSSFEMSCRLEVDLDELNHVLLADGTQPTQRVLYPGE